jgi:uncharacterized membrane protein YidH (DUF202 family)
MNFSFENTLIGIISIIIGVAMIVNAFALNHHVYFLDFVERKFGSGTGTLAYRLIGLGLCILGIFVILGVISFSPNQSSLTGGNNGSNNIQVVPPGRDSTIAP